MSRESAPDIGHSTSPPSDTARAVEPTPIITTPTVRRAARRSLYWVLAIATLLAFAVVMATLNGAGRTAERWGATETAPSGSGALIEVLRNQGVEVVATNTVDDTVSALEKLNADGANVTLFVGDTRDILGAEQWPRLLGVADHLVIGEPSPTALDALGIDALNAGPLDADGARVELEAGCAVSAAQRAASILAAGFGYSTLSGEMCFDAGQAGSALIHLSVNGDEVTVLGAGTVLQNDDIAQAGNAALALGLLGENPALVWYQPSPEDLATATTSELTPGWVNPVAWLALLVALAAAFWRGRRLGPVVVENLPVIVKTTETMEGRARLYARDSSRLRALDALRVGALRRLAGGLALGRAAGVDDIVVAVSSVTGRDARTLRLLLVDTEPRNDRDLIDLSDGLRELEQQFARRVALRDTDGEPPHDSSSERMDP